METQQPVGENPLRKNRRALILAAVGVALCCVCLVIAGISLYSWNSIRGMQTQVFPVEEFTPSVPENALTPATDPNSTSGTSIPSLDVGEAPTGGLGNDILRNDTWQYVASAAQGQGCDQPIGSDSTIEVLQEPDAGGVWLEKWTVVCQSGDSYAYEVEYVLDSTGATFNITPLP
jgi:hypothetical protein